MRIIAFLTILWLLLGVAPACAEKRVALVIGNSNYEQAPKLANPHNDATDVAATLKRLEFEVIVGFDLDQAGMQAIGIRFARFAREADVALFYYSGHALQYAGTNYLLPVDAQLTDSADLRRFARVEDVIADLQQAKNLRILVLDSCRDNPFAQELKRAVGSDRSGAIQRGLARIDSPQGMIVAYATQAGKTADDGRDRNSPYTAAFLKQIDTEEEIGTIFRRISYDVYETTGHHQLPELSLSLIGEFYLTGDRKGSKIAAIPPANLLAPATAPDKIKPESRESEPVYVAFDGNIKVRNHKVVQFGQTKVSDFDEKHPLKESWVIKLDGERVFAINEDSQNYRTSSSIIECTTGTPSIRRDYKKIQGQSIEMRCLYSRDGGNYVIKPEYFISSDNPKLWSVRLHYSSNIKFAVFSNECKLISYDIDFSNRRVLSSDASKNAEQTGQGDMVTGSSCSIQR